MNPVLITMKSRQATPDGKEETELVTTGTCQQEDGVLTLSYEDTEATGFAGSTTTVRVVNDSLVTILRSGSANSNLTLELGKKHFCLYNTPYGAMTIGVQAHKLSFAHDGDCGSIQMEYAVDINATFLSENALEMRWEIRQETAE